MYNSLVEPDCPGRELLLSRTAQGGNRIGILRIANKKECYIMIGLDKLG